MSKARPLYNKDGTLRIKKLGVSAHIISDFYYHLLRISWFKFLTLLISFYLLINTFFASLYFFLPSSIKNVQASSFWDTWIFSFQTSTTLGYGYLYPTNTLTNIIAVFDVISGILFVAVATGIAFTKLSRPSSKILFSKNVLITNYNGRPSLLLRIGNQRANEIIDAEVCMIALVSQVSPEGVSMRRMLDLKLEKNKTPLFSLSWTLMHTIDEESPLYNLKQDDYINEDIRFIISFTGIDDVFSATIHDRHIYSSEKVVFDKYFQDILGKDDKGNSTIDYSKFHLLKS